VLQSIANSRKCFRALLIERCCKFILEFCLMLQNIHRNKMKPILHFFAHWHFSDFLRFLKLYASCLSCSLGLFGGDRMLCMLCTRFWGSYAMYSAMLCYVVCCTLLCYVATSLVSPLPPSCYIMLCHAMLRHVVLRYVLQRYDQGVVRRNII